MKKGGKTLGLAIFSCLIAAGLFLVLAINLENNLDKQINLSLNTTGGFTSCFMLIQIIFEPIYAVIALVLLSLLLYYKKYKEESFVLVVSSIISAGMIPLLKEIIQRARPEKIIESGFSFPSGHATISIIIFGFLIYFSLKNFKKIMQVPAIIFSIFMILLIGFSRLGLGVHWVTDILGGYMLGTIILLVSTIVVTTLRKNP